MPSKKTTDEIYRLNIVFTDRSEIHFPDDAETPGVKFEACAAKLLEFFNSEPAVSSVSIGRVIASYGFKKES